MSAPLERRRQLVARTPHRCAPARTRPSRSHSSDERVAHAWTLRSAVSSSLSCGICRRRPRVDVPGGHPGRPSRQLRPGAATRLAIASRVPDVLIYAGTIRSRELRHEVPIGIPDPFLYVERDGERHVVLTSFEIDRVNAIPGGPEPHPYEEFGYDELLAQGLPREEVYIRVAINACRRFGITEAVGAGDVPGRSSPTGSARRASTLAPEHDLFDGPAAGEERGRARRDPPRAARRRGRRWTRRASCCGARRRTARARGRRRAADVRAHQGGDRRGLHDARDGLRRVHRLARRRRAPSGTTWGPGRSPRASRS